jgi:hypothetical protein
MDAMDADDMKRYICTAFDGVESSTGSGDYFFYYHPDLTPEDRRFPFATIVTGDHYDSVSQLDRDGAYRVNIGLSKDGYTALFGSPPTEYDERGVLVTGFDYTARDTLLPHPIYASQYWVCVVNPGERTSDQVRQLLAEAHRFAARKYSNRVSRARRPGTG